ncbi:MAG: methyltransferase, partial [Nocardioidaceae bacterium]
MSTSPARWGSPDGAVASRPGQGGPRHAALPAGGAVIVSELLVNDEKTGPAPAALMSLNMLIETEGRNYTPAEYGAWLEEAGFRDVRTVWFEAAGANGAVI